MRIQFFEIDKGLDSRTVKGGIYQIWINRR